VSDETVYGLHAVEALLRQDPSRLQRLLVQRGRDDRRVAALLELAAAAGVSVERRRRDVLDELADGRHQGVVAQLTESGGSRDLRWSEAQLLDAVQHSDDLLLLVLDGVTDPHNLGACLRSADAAGATAVITPRDKSADITPVVRKVASGASETVPLVRVTNLARCLQSLQDAGVWVYGAAGEASGSLYDADLSGPLALVMGAEGRGLRRLTREHCDHLVGLPMAGSVSSLNVSVARGICLFEARRQRLAKRATALAASARHG
jgi:23S rRNA (guanosine2251-2'-O)-methyltransferase